MTKSFQDAFEEWKADTRYQIGDDIGWEYSDDKEVRPTRTERSSTKESHGSAYPA